MGLNSYGDDNSHMIEYKFRFIGEQECVYERKNAYESEDLYTATVELFNPVTKQIETRRVTSWYSPVSRVDVVEYIDNIIQIEERAKLYERKQKRKEILQKEYKDNRDHMTHEELCELIDLERDMSLR